MTNLNNAEKTVYKTCELSAKSAIDNAKCVVMIMNIIRENENQILPTDSIEFTMNNNESDLFSRLRQIFNDIFMPKRKSQINIKSIKVLQNNSTKLLNDKLNRPKKLNSQNISYYIQLKNRKSLHKINNCSVSHKQLCSTIKIKNIKNESKSSNNLIIKRPFNKNETLNILNTTTIKYNIRNSAEKTKISKNKFENPISAKEFLLETFRYRRNIYSRIKRNSNDKNDNTLTNLKSLKKLNAFIEQKNYCENFLKKLNNENLRLAL